MVPCEPDQVKVIIKKKRINEYLCHIQEGKEGTLLQTLNLHLKYVSSSILSSIITESTARFGENRVTQLLNDQSAVHVLLSQGTLQPISRIGNAHNSCL